MAHLCPGQCSQCQTLLTGHNSTAHAHNQWTQEQGFYKISNLTFIVYVKGPSPRRSPSPKKKPQIPKSQIHPSIMRIPSPLKKSQVSLSTRSLVLVIFFAAQGVPKQYIVVSWTSIQSVCHLRHALYDLWRFREFSYGSVFLRVL